jgi:hypothetical protein
MATNPIILDAQTLRRLQAPDLTGVSQMPSANPLASLQPPAAPNVTSSPSVLSFPSAQGSQSLPLAQTPATGMLPVPGGSSILAQQGPQMLPVPAQSALQPPSALRPVLQSPAQQNSGPQLLPVPQTQAQQNSGQQLLGAQAEHQRLVASGDGVSQISNPFLRGLARVGDVAESIIAPGAAAFTPGTAMHHQMLLNQNQGQIDNALGAQQQEAQTKLLDATPELKQLTAENAFMKNMGYLQHVSDQGQHYDDQDQHWGNADSATLAAHGYKRDAQGNAVPMSYQEMSPTLQATEDLKASQAELADAAKSYKDAQTKNLPLQMQFAAQRIRTAQINAQTAIGRLGVETKNYAMHAYGTDGNGNELPGVLHDENGNPIGSTQAANARPTGTQRDAAGRADSMVDIGNRVRTALTDPDIRSYLGPVRGRVSEVQGDAGMLPEQVAKLRNDLVSYGAFQAGLHPVRGIGALQYFDHVMGGLGQTPESLLGKLNSNDETAASVQNVGAMPTTAGMQRAATAPHGSPRRGGGNSSSNSVTAPDGSVHIFPNAAAATQFKRAAGIQ